MEDSGGGFQSGAGPRAVRGHTTECVDIGTKAMGFNDFRCGELQRYETRLHATVKSKLAQLPGFCSVTLILWSFRVGKL